LALRQQTDDAGRPAGSGRRRAFAVTHERDLAAGLLERDPIGSRIRLLDDARFDLR
jgi:hypothetical protein